MNRLTAIIVLFVCLAASAQEKIKVLIVTGSNNHNWKETTPVLKETLEQSGRFEVVVSEAPQTLTPGDLGKYDVLLSNYNTFTNRTSPPKDAGWPDGFKNAYVEFVKGGKGHVAVHAGTAGFYDWPEYQQLVQGTFKIGQTSHGKYHEFEVAVASGDHPISKGLVNFKTTDELWHNAAFQPGVTVLATAFSTRESGGSGKEEPVAVAGSFGKGRSVYISLGHDGKACRNSGFQTLLTRSMEWAATGQVTAGGPRIVEAPTSVALVAGDSTVWKFEYDTKLGKPHFSVLGPVGGPSIARVSPADHLWHYGLWFSWKYLNKINYWEENKEHKSEGVNEWKNVRCKAEAGGGARITLDLEYHPQEQAPILTEKRTMQITAPAADGSYTVDWTSEFMAGQRDVVFDRTPIPPEPGSQAWGGYAGLSLRMEQLSKQSVITEAGPITFGKANRFRGPAIAMDYSGELNGKMIGVAMLDHPANLRHPTSWYAIRDGTMNFFNPAILIPGPHTLKAGESFTLRYRILVHSGALDKESLAKAAASFK